MSLRAGLCGPVRRGQRSGTGFGRGKKKADFPSAGAALELRGADGVFRMRLTYHVARHTNAMTVFLSYGVSIETVSRLLENANIKFMGEAGEYE